VNSGSLEYWSTTGNTGTDGGTNNFLGTRDAQPLVIRTNNIRRFTFGIQSGLNLTNAAGDITLRATTAGNLTGISQNTDLGIDGNASQAVTANAITGIDNQNYVRTSSSLTGTLRAQRNRLWGINSQALNEIIGVQNEFRIQGASGNASSTVARSFYSTLNLRSGGGLQNFRLLWNNFDVAGGTGTINRFDGVFLESPQGVVNSYYGFYQNNLGNAANRWVLYYDGDAITSKDVVITGTGRIGVGTDAPTQDIDATGAIRSRSLTSGAVYSDANGVLTNTAVGPQIIAAGVVQGNGTALKIFGATVNRVDEGDYNVVFTNPRSTANYVINLSTIDCGGNCNGSVNTYDDPGITYYNRTVNGFSINVGDSDNGTTTKDDIDIEFSFSVIDF
jgi:hypothetical protein